MRTNFWAGCAQVLLLLFGGAIVLLALPQITKPANLAHIAAATYSSQQGLGNQLVPPKVASQSYAARPGSVVQYHLSISNRNAHAESYSIAVQSSAGWADAASLPTSFSLAANSTAQFTLNVQLPPTSSGLSDDTTITVTTGSGELNRTVLHTVSCAGCGQ